MEAERLREVRVDMAGSEWGGRSLLRNIRSQGPDGRARPAPGSERLRHYEEASYIHNCGPGPGLVVAISRS